jgi:hypothetical protein
MRVEPIRSCRTITRSGHRTLQRPILDIVADGFLARPDLFHHWSEKDFEAFGRVCNVVERQQLNIARREI